MCQAVRTGVYDSYWSKTGTYEALLEYINLDKDGLQADTIDGNEEAVAKAVEEAHSTGTFGISPLFYNDEQALRSVVKFAYISYANNYIKVEELPSGRD